MTLGTSTAWTRCFKPRPDASSRLFCFPHAGGGASAFRLWGDGVPMSVEVHGIQLPGREERMRDAPMRSRTAVVRALADAISPLLTSGPPYSFFGHSLGALLAFELARELRRRGVRGPEQLIVSGRPAPQLPRNAPLHHLPEPELIAELRKMKGMPARLFDDPELIAIFLPLLRADFALVELEPHAPEPPLECPIVAFGGMEDERATPSELDAWREQTAGRFARHMFPGHHFYLVDHRPLVLQQLSSVLTGAGV